MSFQAFWLVAVSTCSCASAYWNLLVHVLLLTFKPESILPSSSLTLPFALCATVSSNGPCRIHAVSLARCRSWFSWLTLLSRIGQIGKEVTKSQLPSYISLVSLSCLVSKDMSCRTRLSLKSCRAVHEWAIATTRSASYYRLQHKVRFRRSRILDLPKASRTELAILA